MENSNSASTNPSPMNGCGCAGCPEQPAASSEHAAASMLARRALPATAPRADMHVEPLHAKPYENIANIENKTTRQDEHDFLQKTRDFLKKTAPRQPRNTSKRPRSVSEAQVESVNEGVGALRSASRTSDSVRSASKSVTSRLRSSNEGVEKLRKREKVC